MLRGCVLALLVAGCGRIGFGDSARLADAPNEIDATIVPIDGAMQILRFGNRGDVDVPGTIVDTMLDDNEPQNNFGSHLDLHLDSSPGTAILLRVELGGVASTSTVVAARLVMTVANHAVLPTALVRVYRMREAWVEGTGDHSPGSCNHDERAPGVPWLNVGANAPGSRDAAPLTTKPGPFAELQPVYLTLPIDVVQDWVTNPSSNVGVLIRGEDPGGLYSELGSSDHVEVALRPVFELAVVP